MSTTSEIQRIELALAIEDGNSITVTPTLLKAEGIIPADWQLAQSLTRTDNSVAFSFQNGIHILHQGNLLTFLENVDEKTLEELEAPQIVQSYLKKFPNLNYRALGTNLEGYTTFSSEFDACSYLVETFSNSSYKHQSDNNLVQAVASFSYKLDSGLLTITSRNGVLRTSNEERVAVVGFFGNFYRDVSRASKENQLRTLSRFVSNWQADVETYKKIVNERFLAHRVEQFV